jgi:hypothetical protein
MGLWLSTCFQSSAAIDADVGPVKLRLRFNGEPPEEVHILQDTTTETRETKLTRVASLPDDIHVYS